MRAGPLRHRLRIERATEAPSSSGEPIPTWSSLRTVWAGIKPTRGSEGIHGGGPQGLENFLIRIRGLRSQDVGPKDRLVEVHGAGRTFDIVSVANIETLGRLVEIVATEHRGD